MVLNKSIELSKINNHRHHFLVVQLLHKLSIRSVSGSEKLLRVIKNPVTDHLPTNCRKLGNFITLSSYLQTFHNCGILMIHILLHPSTRTLLLFMLQPFLLTPLQSASPNTFQPSLPTTPSVSRLVLWRMAPTILPTRTWTKRLVSPNTHSARRSRVGKCVARWRNCGVCYEKASKWIYRKPLTGFR